MASPSRRLGVQAVSQLRRLARHGLGDYGVASRALVVALASDSSRRTLHGRKIGCARGKKGGGKRARGKSSTYTSCVGAPHPSSTQNRESGREREEEERAAAAAPGIRWRAASIQPPLLLPLRLFKAPAAPRPLTSAPPIRPSDWASNPPICPFDLTSARRSAPPIGPPPVDLHFRPLPPSIRGCFLCSASMLASFMLAHKYTLLSLLCSSSTFFLCSESFGLGHTVVMPACACALLASSLWCWLFVLAC